MNESPELLKEDILNAGAGSSWHSAIEELINNGSIYVKKWLIDRFKIPFDKIGIDLHFTTRGNSRIKRQQRITFYSRK